MGPGPEPWRSCSNSDSVWFLRSCRPSGKGSWQSGQRAGPPEPPVPPALRCGQSAPRQARQKLWPQGSVTGSRSGSRQMGQLKGPLPSMAPPLPGHRLCCSRLGGTWDGSRPAPPPGTLAKGPAPSYPSPALLAPTRLAATAPACQQTPWGRPAFQGRTTLLSPLPSVGGGGGIAREGREKERTGSENVRGYIGRRQRGHLILLHLGQPGAMRGGRAQPCTQHLSPPDPSQVQSAKFLSC